MGFIAQRALSCVVKLEHRVSKHLEKSCGETCISNHYLISLLSSGEICRQSCQTGEAIMHGKREVKLGNLALIPR